jgi:hypothetical protein
VTTLLARLEYVLAKKGLSGRQFAKDAGLYPTNITTLMGRLRKDPAARAEHETLVAVARLGEVHLHWLTTGEGPRDLDDTAPPEGAPARTVEPDDRYWARSAALKNLEGVEGFTPQAAAATRQLDFKGAENYSLEQWTDIALGVQRRQNQAREDLKKNPLPPVHDGFDSPGMKAAYLAEVEKGAEDEETPKPPETRPLPGTGGGAKKGTKGRK